MSENTAENKNNLASSRGRIPHGILHSYTAGGFLLEGDMIPEMLVVALTIMAEGEAESWAGKVMVAEVIVNRSHASGKTLSEICLAKKQFSCWNGARVAKLEAKLCQWDTIVNDQNWKDAKRIARMICQPGYQTSTSATHYYNPDLCSPRWAKSMVIVASVGHHLFLRNKVEEIK